MKKFLFAVLMTLPSLAFADQITGNISLNGVDTYGSGLVSFQGPGNVGVGTASGSFSPGFDTGCTGCVALTDFNYDGSFAGPVTVYNAMLGDLSTAFELDAITTVAEFGSFLSIEGTGIATLTGYDPTPGIFDFSTQGGEGNRVTFSATTSASPVPEPLSVAMLGTGLLSLGVMRRKRG